MHSIGMEQNGLNMSKDNSSKTGSSFISADLKVKAGVQL